MKKNYEIPYLYIKELKSNTKLVNDDLSLNDINYNPNDYTDNVK